MNSHMSADATRVTTERHPRRLYATLAIVIAVALSAFLIPARQGSPVHAASLAAGKKTCKYVTKKIHGKKKRVKVCTPRKTPTPTPAATADDLAIQLAKARDLKATYSATRAAIEAAHIPITKYTGGTPAYGRAIYDTEVGIIALEEMGGDTSTISAVAAALAPLKLTGSDGTPLSGQTLSARLSADIAAEAASSGGAITRLSLIRALGLHHQQPSDLAQGANGDTKLDPLQRYLLEDYLLFPQTASPSLHAHLVSLDDAAAWIHAQSIESNLRIEPEDDSLQKTHFGPAGHDADDGEGGKPLVFKLVVRTRHSIVVDGNCFSVLLGLNGSWCSTVGGLAEPIPQAKISWETGLLAPRFGSITDTSKGSRPDAKNGMASITFTPKDEAIPGFGTVHHEISTVWAHVDLSGLLGRLDPKVLDFVQTAYRNVPFDWEVSYHLPRGFKFENLRMNWTWDAGQATMQETHIVSGHACGADPTAQPWTLHFERHTILAGKDIDPNGGDVPFTVTPDLSFLAPSAYNDPSSLGSMFGADFFGGSQVQMRITGTTSMSVMVKTHNLMSSYGASTLIPVDNGGSAPLEEDRSCPYVPLP